MAFSKNYGQPARLDPATSLVVILGSLAFLVGAFVMAGYQIRALARGWDARSWVSTQGIVEAWHVDVGKKDGPPYTPWLSYVYVVDSKRFRGTRFTLATDSGMGFNSYDSETAALQTLRSYRIGHPVKVFYNPENPWDAVLDTSIGETIGFAFVIFLFGFPMALSFGLGGLANVFGDSRPVLALAVLCLVPAYYVLPVWKGNADTVSGGPAEQQQLQQEIEDRRALWRQLKVGDSEEALRPLKRVAQITRSQTAEGEVSIWNFKRQPYFEQEGKVLLKADSKNGTKRVVSLKAPFLLP